MPSIFKYDHFGARPSVNLYGHSRAPSTLGLSLTWILGSLLILITVFFSKDLVARKNPNIIPSTINEGFEGDVIRFTADSLYLTMNDYINNVSWVDETVYTIQAEHYDQFDPVSKFNPVKFYPCPVEQILTQTKYPGYVWCVDPSPENVKHLQTCDQAFNTQKINLMPCKNGSSIVCKPQEEIDYKLRMTIRLLYALASKKMKIFDR